MKKALVIYAVLLTALMIFPGCATEQVDTELERQREIARTRAAEIINEMKYSYTHPEITTEYIDELVGLGKFASEDLLQVIVDETQPPKLRADLMNVFTRSRDMRATPFLIHMLDADREDTRETARYVLRNITGEDFHFLPGAKPGRKHYEGLNRWQTWWLRNQERMEEKYGSFEYPSSWFAPPAALAKEEPNKY